MTGPASITVPALTRSEAAAQPLPDVDELLQRAQVTTARLQVAIRAGYLRRPLAPGPDLEPLDAGTWRPGGPPAVITNAAA